MAREFRASNGKKITVHNDGEIFVNGKATGLKQWQSSSTKYSNLSGTEQKDIKGLGVEDALWKRGLLWCLGMKIPRLFFLYFFYDFI